jgi:hypothetical protein
MTDYRCYPLTLSDLIDGPATVVDVDDDACAIAKAHEILPERPFEVWQGARRVYHELPIRRRISG